MPDQDEKKSGLSKQAEQKMEEVELIEDDHRRTFTGGGAPYDRRGPEDKDERRSDAENVPAIDQD
ncbi:hypothetical protein [Deinococcus aluminii]|uniref:Uncharacterized protein n=1 Tax=Deinococcus aluminii TaxID=1656885 RepID=A0ABP9XJ27_9DEIO